jgi:hypothetical protein
MSLGRPRKRWEDNTKLYFGEVCCVDLKGNELLSSISSDRSVESSGYVTGLLVG